MDSTNKDLSHSIDASNNDFDYCAEIVYRREVAVREVLN
jgi:hypothetical protein